MSFWQMSRLMERMMDEYMREMSSNNNRLGQFYRDSNQSMLAVANEAHQLSLIIHFHVIHLQVVDDDKKFAVSVDVSQFKPEEIKVNLDGRVITIEGKQESKSENSYMSRSFVRSWTLPEEVNTSAIRTELNDQGKLIIEAPKTINNTNKRTIPIHHRASPSILKDQKPK
ncbi:Hsp20/alpha crystallin family protein [Dictyocaulus viviparus]|uniref:Hsp20/alpha crystallin family protein n=1 Tax=Dictyocaulus viviparus TaxID=29172 RepID=A0A0D8Y174_DICVI|nr:Hsp20/alpha crystallin family protein [Dictyocaulus viviparus]